MIETIKNQILSDAFENMLNEYGEYVKEEVAAEKGRIYADGYFDAVDDVLEIVEEVSQMRDKNMPIELIRRKVLALIED